MLLQPARRGNAVDSVPARHLHSSLNKMRHPVNVVKWTPEGRRLLTGSTSGEFTLWNGTAFNFETIMQVSRLAAVLQDISLMYEARLMTVLYEPWPTHTATTGSFQPNKLVLSNTGSPTSTTSSQYRRTTTPSEIWPLRLPILSS